MKKIGTFKVESLKEIKSIKVSNLNDGINDVGNHFIKLTDNKVEYVIDKICKHAGGRMILKNSMAVCPMHGWKLNLNSLIFNDSEYGDKPVCKEKTDFKINTEGNLEISNFDRWLVNPFNGAKKGTVKVRWLNHAAVYIECNGMSIVTDPWLFGPAFMTGWWLVSPSPEDSIDLLKKADYVYISHNHPDHLHAETLSLLPRDKKIIVAGFTSRSSEKYIKSLGFSNVISLNFNDIFELCEGFQISILKSGDFRDDSGIYISANGHQLLLTVDANFLNSHVLPRGIDLLMTSFASGASGFPLCYENFTEDEKLAIVKRNRNSAKFSVSLSIEHTTPKYYMPYAGMFTEYSPRDKYIGENNIKNSVGDLEEITKKFNAKLLRPSPSTQMIFRDGDLTIDQIDVSLLSKEDPLFYVNKLKEEYRYNTDTIIDYLRRSDFGAKQILQIIPTDDEFGQIVSAIVYADFSSMIFKVISPEGLIDEMDGYRVMQIKIRPEILMCVIENKLPWEDFLIGFQSRIRRYPNEYESDFWYHFTNKYIGEQNFRYSSFCGACTVIDQNPIWINKSKNAITGPIANVLTQ